MSGSTVTCWMLLAGLVALASSRAEAQMPIVHDELRPAGFTATDPQLVFLLQGEKRKIANDFVANLDGEALRISLEERGLVRTSAENELLVSLLYPSGERQDRRPDATGQVFFDQVKSGLAALVVTADSVSEVSLTRLYAAMPLFLVTEEDGAPRAEAFSAPLAVVDPTSLVRRLNVGSSVPPRPAKADELLLADDFERVSASRFTVQRMADGSVQGRVVVPQRGYLEMPGATRLTFHQNGALVASAVSDEEGFFVVEDIPLGQLSVIATGSSGHAAYMIDVVEFQGAGRAADGTEAGWRRKQLMAEQHLVARQVQVAQSLIVVLVPPSLMDDVRSLLAERMLMGTSDHSLLAGPASAAGFPDEDQQTSTAGGGWAASGGAWTGFGAGTGAGGSGGWGTGAGGGAPLGLAALAAGVAALEIDDDDGFSSNISTPLEPVLQP